MTEQQLERLRRILAEQGSQPGDPDEEAHEPEPIPLKPLDPALEDRLVAIALAELGAPSATRDTREAKPRALPRRRRRWIWGAIVAAAAAVALIVGARRLEWTASTHSGADQFLGERPSGPEGQPETSPRMAPSGSRLSQPRNTDAPGYEIMIRDMGASPGDRSFVPPPARLRVTPHTQLQVRLRAISATDNPLTGRVFLIHEGRYVPLPAAMNPDEQRPGTLVLDIDLSRARVDAIARGTLLFVAAPEGSQLPSASEALEAIRSPTPPAEPWRVLGQDIEVLSP